MIKKWRFNPKVPILREDDPGESAFFIESGKVEVTKRGEAGTVHIAFLGPGDTFGEMSMVDDLPRSASVTAVEETVVSEFHRDQLYAAMREDPELFGRFLKCIFDRLREANRTIISLDPDGRSRVKLANIREPGSASDRWYLEGLTPQATASLGGAPCPIPSFPFKIGRKSDDPFLYNHLEIADTDPPQISRHHVTLERNADGQVGAADRGSDKGTLVDGRRIGGKHGPGPIWFSAREGELVLGDDDSPFRFRVGVTRG